MKVLATLALATVLMGGCASANYTAHPGSVNLFDSQSYDTLLVAHAAIETTKADLAAGKFTANVASAVKESLNYLIQAYNVADTAYQAYHVAALAGASTPTQITQVQTSLTQLNSAVTGLASAKGAQ